MMADAAHWPTGQLANGSDSEITASGIRLVLPALRRSQMDTASPGCSIGKIFRPVCQFARWPVGRD
jgi:hypothetical protein